MVREVLKQIDHLTSPLSQKEQKALLGIRIAERVQNGQILGIGSGTTVVTAIRAIGQRIENGELSCIYGVTSSELAAEEARKAGITVIELERLTETNIDWGFDGADKVAFRQVDGEQVEDGALVIADLIKGGGGAMMRERQVAKACPYWIVIADKSKIDRLGFPIPIEFEEEQMKSVRQDLTETCQPTKVVLRQKKDGSGTYYTDNRNPIFDVFVSEGSIEPSWEETLDNIPGVLNTGLFLGGYPDEVLIADASGKITTIPGPENR